MQFSASSGEAALISAGRPPLSRIVTTRNLLVAMGGILVCIGALIFAAASGATLADPVGARTYEVIMVVAAAGLLGIGATQSIRHRRLSRPLLVALAAGSAFWQETYGDWGAYLLYSDRFSAYDWGHTRWSSPVQCWWFIPGYMVFYTSFFLGLTAAVKFVRHRWPDANPYILATLLSLPAFYVFDLAWEGTTTGLGYWSYLYTFGPALHLGNGAFPLLWPILEQVPFMALAAFALTWRNRDGDDVFEIAARVVTRTAPSQLAILASWIVILNVAFLTTTILPIMTLRWVAGPPFAAIP